MARTFFYVTGGTFFIAATLALLWSVSQQGGRVVAVQAANALYVVTANGDVFASGGQNGGWSEAGNIHSGRKQKR